jgi:hypothetical protein
MQGAQLHNTLLLARQHLTHARHAAHMQRMQLQPALVLPALVLQLFEVLRLQLFEVLGCTYLQRSLALVN